jgi:hypothetical protein
MSAIFIINADWLWSKLSQGRAGTNSGNTTVAC